VRGPTTLPTSGARFQVTYRLTPPSGREEDARVLARALCVEQTVEFPADLLPPGPIPEEVVARLVALQPAAPLAPAPGDTSAPAPPAFDATLDFAVETAGTELTQLLNVLFGNASLLPGVRLQGLALPPALLAPYPGPRFGRAGLRALLGVPERPLVATALKPMGLDVPALAQLAYELALGGVDILKDDHGLADQPFAPFAARVEACAAAVARANAETGGHTLYAPNVSAPADAVLARARFAKEAGAGALMAAAGLVGFDALRALAADDSLALPLLGHPAWLGSHALSPARGVSHGVLFGALHRLAGADAVIFPNFGGRFSFPPAACAEIRDATAAPLSSLAPIFPAPAGGMTLARVPEMLSFYGPDVLLLIGGDLHRHPDGLVAACRALVEAAQRAMP